MDYHSHLLMVGSYPYPEVGNNIEAVIPENGGPSTANAKCIFEESDMPIRWEITNEYKKIRSMGIGI